MQIKRLGANMEKFKESIIKLLQENARYTNEHIATMLNKSVEEVSNAVKALENDGIIVKYAAVINNDRANNEYVNALIEVKVTPQKRSGFESIAMEIMKFDMVKNLYLMSGTFDLALTVEGKTMRDIAMFVSERLSTIDAVISTATHFILKQYKNGGVMLFSDDEEKKREIVSV